MTRETRLMVVICYCCDVVWGGVGGVPLREESQAGVGLTDSAHREKINDLSLAMSRLDCRLSIGTKLEEYKPPKTKQE